MTSDDWINTLQLIPLAEHSKLIIVLQNGTELCVDAIVRYEPEFLVIRGRQGGQVEEGRGFFVPYRQFLCLRLDRVMKSEELQAFFGADGLAAMDVIPEAAESAQPAQAVPTDPAIASKLLLERIRAVRASSASSISRFDR
jgi:hypothetical protein